MQQQQQEAGKKQALAAVGFSAGRKRRTPAGSSVRANQQAYGTAAVGSGSGSRQLGGRPPPFPPSGPGSGGFRGPRPPELTLCREVAEAGRCYIHNCRFAHSEASARGLAAGEPVCVCGPAWDGSPCSLVLQLHGGKACIAACLPLCRCTADSGRATLCPTPQRSR